MKLTFPTILAKCRSEHGKRIRRLYKNDVGVPYQEAKGYAPRMDGIAMTVTTFSTDNNIIYLNDMRTRPEYKPNPTKDDLRDYFAPRVAVRKMTCIEAMRLMDVEDSDIQKIVGYPFNSLSERNEWIRNQNIKIEELQHTMTALSPKTAEWREARAQLKSAKRDRKDKKDKFIAKTSVYKLAGNSIVVSCLFHIFRTMFIPGQPENEVKRTIIQPSLFD